ncbi:uncharacterized protein L3040_007684 [Drepanopeziza brunnea f. sp. 'multigermtubi']|uniref:FAR-17a/AIG1-like protein n=1 Tax=Marssonina brunnea f. sp. multigermtubi (strain MB_m1) TaxID=1072389 RepID=K1WZT2_MARBU|nr:uncharacterized protein MBM_03909 [Drepanopeziza brunnea f. sp. 'multigermtubi' MB_m1]EKD18137.1 hypothetical protein MBM_03909 [Drepanopeziza brunnea f. sp. 'multigermtubi' MB_m1]KAJ5037510.1 hypothetical protein L3040_007684 [Drepanopeziza brunnea f. sp. 'multigermtubi']
MPISKIFNRVKSWFSTARGDTSHRFETSWILSPGLLFAIRAAISLYAFSVVFFIIGWELAGRSSLSVHDVNKSFSFFTGTTEPLTVLCYWGLCFYFLVAAIHTASYATTNGGTPFLNRMSRPLQALHSLFYTTITTYPFLVTIVYWALIYGPDHPYTNAFSLWSNISQHGLNSAFALFEILLTRTAPPPWIHFPWLVVILLCYLGVAYITYATKHYFVYRFLNFKPAQHVTLPGGGTENIGGVGAAAVVAYGIGIAVAILVIFCASRMLIQLRLWVTETKMGKRGVFCVGRGQPGGDVELETSRPWEADKP